jgi:hypothetical protein
VHWLALSFATAREPGAHGFGEALGLNAEAGFEKTVGDRERIVKFGLPGEVAHTKIIKPIERARLPFGAYDHFDAELPSIHDASIA